MKMKEIDFDLDVNNLDHWNGCRYPSPVEEIWKEHVCQKDELVLFPIQEIHGRYSSKRKCQCCGREFVINNSRQVFCGFCFYVNICSWCGKIFLTQSSRGKNDELSFCSKRCSSSNAASHSCDNLKEYWCEKCQMITKHNLNGTCRSCIGKETDNLKEFRESEEGAKLRQKNCESWNGSQKGKEFHSMVIRKYLKSEKGKDHTKSNLIKIHKRMANGELANSKENLLRRMGHSERAYIRKVVIYTECAIM